VQYPRKSAEEVGAGIVHPVHSVTLTSGERLVFDGEGGTYDADSDYIRGTLRDGRIVEIPLSKVREVQLKASHRTRTYLLIAGLGLAAVAVAVVIAARSGHYGLE
jgi:hypothetical protein